MINLLAESLRYYNCVKEVDSRTREVFGRLRLEFDATLGSTAGTCGGTTIKIHPAQSGPDQLDTLGHEIAHALDGEIFGGRGHGYGWAYWMRKLNLPVHEHHNIQELIRLHKGPVYAVTCMDCGHKFVSLRAAACCADKECQSRYVQARRDGIGGLL